MKSHLKKAVSFLLIATTLCCFAPVSALVPTSSLSLISPSDYQDLSMFMESNGVAPETIHVLLKKLEQGKSWDSLLPNAKPVAVSIEGGGFAKKRINTFADGSISVSSVSQDPLSLNAVSGGKWQSGSGYSNCTGGNVSEDYGIVKLAFQADFTIAQDGPDEILKVYNPTYRFILCSYDTHDLTIVKNKEDSNGVASARLSLSYTLLKIAASSNCTLTLNVGNNKYTSSFWAAY